MAMNGWTRRRAVMGLAAMAAGSASLVARAQAWPTRPITLVVPFSVGGSADILARGFGESLSRELGTPVVVDNRVGAGGAVGSSTVSRAAADGYTLLFGTIGTHAINATLKKSLPYDIERDFVSVARMQDCPLVLVVNGALPVKNVKELVAYAKARPGQLSYASAGIGSISHLAGELMKSEAHVDIVHIPYRGGGSAIPDLLSGQVGMMIETLPNTLISIRSGGIRPLAVTGAKRHPSLPDVPTFAELGMPGMTIDAWTGLFAPAKTPPAVVARLAAAVNKINASGDYIAKTEKVGYVVAPSGSSSDFGGFVRDEIHRWQTVAAQAGIQPE